MNYTQIVETKVGTVLTIFNSKGEPLAGGWIKSKEPKLTPQFPKHGKPY